MELLAELMRGVVQSSEKDLYPLEREINLAKTYLAIEQIRHGDRLEFEINISDDLMNHPVPPFSVQPLIENAVKYSLDAQLGVATIMVKATRVRQQLVITVTDNGPGIGKDSTHTGGLGMALGNIRERLNKLYSGKGSLRLLPGKCGGTDAVLSTPWNNSNREDVSDRT